MLRALRRSLCAGALCAACVLPAGCALFSANVGALGTLRDALAIDDSEGTWVQTRKLPNPAAVRNTIHIDVMSVDKPVDDPLVGPELWREINQVGAIGAVERSRLDAVGIRVGHVGARPPEVLEKILGLRTEFQDAALDKSNAPFVRRLVLTAGAEREIESSSAYPECELDVAAPGEDNPLPNRFENARCVFRMTAHRTREQLVRIEFVPEIHHGPCEWRPVVIDHHWQGRTRQAITPLYHLKFAVELNSGEMVVLGGDEGNPSPLGRHFFFVKDPQKNLFTKKRFLVIRAVEINQPLDIYSK